MFDPPLSGFVDKSDIIFLTTAESSSLLSILSNVSSAVLLVSAFFFTVLTRAVFSASVNSFSLSSFVLLSVDGLTSSSPDILSIFIFLEVSNLSITSIVIALADAVAFPLSMASGSAIILLLIIFLILRKYKDTFLESYPLEKFIFMKDDCPRNNTSRSPNIFLRSIFPVWIAQYMHDNIFTVLPIR